LTKIQQGIVNENLEHQDAKRLLPIFAPYDTTGSTRYVDFLTTKPVSETVKSHVNYVVADTEEWEQGVAKRLEQMPEVLAYVKNQNLGFTIPYEHQGISRQYIPDFIVKLDMSLRGGALPPKQSPVESEIASAGEEQERPSRNDILYLLIEVTGKKDDKKALKVKTTREMWIPAVNNSGRYGTWAILEVQDIHETMNLIRAGMERGFDNLMLGTMFENQE
jgi:type III restriction enzyme